jgi:hypothetical protein
MVDARSRFREIMAARLSSPHINHRNHLCAMVEGGDVSLEQMKDLVRDANFICQFCGRVAVNHNNLCDPVSIVRGSCGIT